MNAVGIIFANIHPSQISELTEKRTMCSVPFGGRYRLIDFSLSMVVNANISKVGVITRQNYQSLMDHLSTGKEWDLARKTGGLFIFPPFGRGKSSQDDTRVESLIGISGFINRSDEEYVVIADGDCVYNIDLEDVLEQHIKCQNDVTVVYSPMEINQEKAQLVNSIEIANDMVSGVLVPASRSGKVNVLCEVYVLKRTLLQQLLSDALVRGQTHWHREVLGKNLHRLKIGAYKYKGVCFIMENVKSFFKSNMQLLDRNIRNELFNVEYRPIFTKVKDSAPTKFFDNAKVKNCLIADGCQIQGEVENCIIFRDVTVLKGTVIKNSILMQNTYVGENVRMDYCLTDKNVVIRNDRQLAGCDEQPYILTKDTMV